MSDPKDSTTEGLTPRELVNLYPPLAEAIGPLRTLLEVNAFLVDDLLVFAMALGIHAAEHRMALCNQLQQLEHFHAKLSPVTETTKWPPW